MKNKFRNSLNIETAGNFLGLSVESMIRNLRTGEGPICHEDGLASVYCEGSLRNWALMKGRGVDPNALK